MSVHRCDDQLVSLLSEYSESDRHGNLLLPTKLCELLNSAEHATSESAKSASQVTTDAREAGHPQQRKISLDGMRRVFKEADLTRFHAAIKSQAKGTDRRQAMESLQSALQRGPLGYRKVSQVPKDLEQRLMQLRREMPNFEGVIEQIEALLQLQGVGDGAICLPPILLAGDPGVGKTYFAARLAKLLSLQYHLVNMETMTASWVLSGSSTSWAAGGPGAVFNAVVNGPCANPLFLLDELDKAGQDQKYPPINTLYALLEPGTARQFRDESCPEVPIDVSGINWIATANTLENIPEPLRNRLMVFHVPPPSHAQRQVISRGVYRGLLKEYGWGKHFAPELTEASAIQLASSSGSTRGMRTLIQLGLAMALRRGSNVLEPEDFRQLSRRALSHVDLEQVQVQGHA